MPAFVSIRNGPFRDVSRADVRRWATCMLTELDLAKVELSVVLTDDVEIRELNSVFRQRDKATDVLAFAMREGEPLGGGTAASVGAPGEILGDVVISIETARRQSKEHRRTLTGELQMLLAHGLLHLVGYDHQNRRDELAMNAETERLCRAARVDGAAPRAKPVRDRARSDKSGGSAPRAVRGNATRKRSTVKARRPRRSKI